MRCTTNKLDQAYFTFRFSGLNYFMHSFEYSYVCKHTHTHTHTHANMRIYIYIYIYIHE